MKEESIKQISIPVASQLQSSTQAAAQSSLIVLYWVILSLPLLAV